MVMVSFDEHKSATTKYSEAGLGMTLREHLLGPNCINPIEFAPIATH